MDFELNKEQKQIQKAIREFIKGEFKKDIIQELLEKHEYPVKIWKKPAELGFIGIHYPEKYSGMGLWDVWRTSWWPRNWRGVTVVLVHAC